jgi:hypothetical protein
VLAYAGVRANAYVVRADVAVPPSTVAVWKELYKFLSKYHLIGQERRELIQRYAVSMCVCVCVRERESDANSFRGTLSVCVFVCERQRARERERRERIQSILILHILLCVHVC